MMRMVRTEPDDAILHFIDRVKDIRRTLVMRHDDNATSLFVSDLTKKLHDLSAAMAVEGCRRFIRQDHLWLVRQGASHGHALLLATGEHCRIMVGAVGHTEVIE